MRIGGLHDPKVSASLRALAPARRRAIRRGQRSSIAAASRDRFRSLDLGPSAAREQPPRRATRGSHDRRSRRVSVIARRVEAEGDGAQAARRADRELARLLQPGRESLGRREATQRDQTGRHTRTEGGRRSQGRQEEQLLASRLRPSAARDAHRVLERGRAARRAPARSDRSPAPATTSRAPLRTRSHARRERSHAQARDRVCPSRRAATWTQRPERRLAR
jgi:hypothetical protein